MGGMISLNSTTENIIFLKNNDRLLNTIELYKKGIHINYQEVLHNIRERDQMDSTRKESPLRKAEDAITLDNTSMTKQEQAKISLQWAKGVIAALDE